MKTKKAIALFTAILFTLTLLCGLGLSAGAADGALMRGDLDGDGEVTAADARIALRASSRLTVINEAQTEAADVDGDGEVTAADARIILRYSSRLIDSLYPLTGTFVIVDADLFVDEEDDVIFELDVKNNTNQNIINFEILILCYDADDEDHYATFEGYYDEKIAAGEDETVYWVLTDWDELFEFEEAPVFLFCITSYKAGNGTTVNIAEDDFEWFEIIFN